LSVRQAKVIRARQRLGKYKIERKLAQGGFADVYRAYDTIEGIRVALKIPQAALLSEALLADFKSEVRLTGRLDHPNILPIKNALQHGRTSDHRYLRVEIGAVHGDHSIVLGLEDDSGHDWRDANDRGRAILRGLV